MQIATKQVAHKDADTNLNGIFFWDESHSTKRPGILVVHGGAGLDDHAKNRARRFAELGYIAFACDMYGEGVAGSRGRIMARINELRVEPDRLPRRANAGIDVLRSHPLTDGRIAAVGYCFGGMTVLELARSGAPISGVISVHGSLDTKRPASPDGIQAKILILHGALDPHVPLTQVTAFADEMKSANADWQLVIYGQAMHGFTHEDKWNVPGVAYHAPSDTRSWRAIESFLTEIFAT
ncbi:MAG: dienelactone hydrolase family protein [Acidobacteria bacterium]|nr:dienelactone hydrolase family protein [Acidobacteriota bacterium]